MAIASQGPATRMRGPLLFPLLALLGFLLRLLLFAALGSPLLLRSSPELNSPINDYERLQEAVAALSKGADPYAASLFHQPPLVLYLFSTTSHILPLQWGAIVIIAASDVVCAAFLYKASRESLFIPCAYLFNPISILSCLSLSGQALHMALVAGCLCPGLISCLSIATLAYVRCNPLLPFALVLSKSAMECPTGSCLGSRLLRNCVATGTYFVSLLLASFIAMGSWEGFVAGIRGTMIDPFLISELQPNIGLHWYMFTEVFPRFYSLFLFVFQMLPLVHVLPLYFRLGVHGGEYARQSHTWNVVALTLLFQPYPTVMTIPKQHSSRLSHQALDFLLLSVLLLLHYEDLTKVKAFTKLYDEDDKAGERATELQPNNYEQFMILFLAIGTLTLVLHPAMTLLWLGRNTGNPNFVFVSNLLHQGACGVAASVAVATSIKVYKENKRWQQQQRDDNDNKKKNT
ncbi:conserved hypothetical protein [Perkinsus marinus ATCC 50983]|uniref:GPI transamidase subunit PIG-U n=1 Tax=Perkinsus marinus (strain ATCC 50983 / TXsc) TaxID=423536 RepID=C5L3N8_PERM5|nr:conserved hypothetical protein [Perkinsus marinus ATCC 50983]EER08617.1 conserved hypothetical protein [Perkinsus marinus ATCC 50983]|eukprot:XP_002776801.1 conserved hypothetical protein [Perkinsus marinus ATCC 50983]